MTVKRNDRGRGYGPVADPRPRHVRSTSALRPQGGTAEWSRIRLVVLRRDRWTCQYCGAPADTVDHKKPRHMGGDDRLSNLCACCRPCQQPQDRSGAGSVGSRGTVGHRGYAPVVVRSLRTALSNDGARADLYTQKSPPTGHDGEFPTQKGGIAVVKGDYSAINTPERVMGRNKEVRGGRE